MAAKLTKVAKDKKAKLAERLEAVQAVAKGRNALLIKPLAQVIRTDSAITVRKAAIGALSVQPAQKARPAILNELRAEDQAPEITAALVTALGAAGYQPADWPRIEPIFARDFGEKHTQVQKAILALVIATEEKQAWRLLVAHLDEPIPADVDAADNPPAEYWERRWKAWRAWRADVKEALFTLTGQRFSSSKEARTWIDANGARIGLR
jgi:HEAT repeat protein